LKNIPSMIEDEPDGDVQNAESWTNRRGSKSRALTAWRRDDGLAVALMAAAALCSSDDDLMAVTSSLWRGRWRRWTSRRWQPLP
jgi:hypothetical protein